MKKNFETWARDLAPPMNPDEVSRKIHLAVLKDRMRTMENTRQRRHARVRKASMVAVFVCVTFVGGYLSELGSDNFAVMSQKHDDRTGIDFLEIGHAGGTVSGKSVDVEKAVEWADLEEAGLWKPVQCQMIEIHGKRFWLTMGEFDLLGEVEVRHTTIRDRETVVTDEIAAFMAQDYGDWVMSIKAGQTEDEGTFFEVIDGHRYLCRVFTREYPNFGLVTMYRGVYAPN